MNLPVLFKKTVKTYGHCNAMAIVGEVPKTYQEIDRHIRALIAFLEQLGINPGDKVAILSPNMPNWGITYYAITFMGAVAVPLLPDFLPGEIENILNHSESKAIFVSESLSDKVSSIKSDFLKDTVIIDDFLVKKSENSGVFFNPDAEPAREYQVKDDDLASIIYTSGTTGKSKGVMLSHKNICFNALKGKVVQPVDENDRFLSILPLSHTYENTLGLILPMLGGSCIYYIGKSPTPGVLLPALKIVKPTVMLTVPLIIEKIYRTKILPTLTKSWISKALYKIPSVRRVMNRIAGKKLMKTFGGKLHFFGIGGAKLDRNVESFLIEARFPYAIGYGLTETSPLLAGVNPQTIRLESTGPAIEGVQLKINNPDKHTAEGEIWAKGPNVMMGYFKEPLLTKEVITADGWFKTGDLGVFDKDGYLYIKGRIKNIIVGANGENIYPEEIESVINNFPLVNESLVVEKKGKLVALVHFNHEEIEQRYHHLKNHVENYVERKKEESLIEIREYVNKRVNKFSQLQTVIVQPDPFKKTPTHKIKRFLYT